MKGGKLIGEGSSTCVFQPNLPCKNNQKSRYTDVLISFSMSLFINKTIFIHIAKYLFFTPIV